MPVAVGREGGNGVSERGGDRSQLARRSEREGRIEHERRPTQVDEPCVRERRPVGPGAGADDPVFESFEIVVSVRRRSPVPPGHARERPRKDITANRGGPCARRRISVDSRATSVRPPPGRNGVAGPGAGSRLVPPDPAVSEPGPGRPRGRGNRSTGSTAGARIRTWELLREQILSLPPLAARPPRRARRETSDRLNPLRRPRRPWVPLPAAPPPRQRTGRDGTRTGRPPAHATAGSASCDFVRRRGRSSRDGRPAVGCGPFSPRSSRRNSPDSRVRGTRGAVGRCIGCRSVGRDGRSGRPIGGRPSSLRARPGRRGPRSAPERCGPWSRCAAPGGRRALPLRRLAYRTVDSGPGDDGAAARAVLSERRRRHRSHRPGRDGLGCRVRNHPGRRVAPGRGGRRYDAPDGARGGPRGADPREEPARGSHRLGLGQSVAALRAEQRAFRGELTAMNTDRHVGGKVNGVYHRQVHR